MVPLSDPISARRAGLVVYLENSMTQEFCVLKSCKRPISLVIAIGSLLEPDPRMKLLLSVGVAVLSLMLLSSVVRATEYCTKEQYERDRAFIENATSSGWFAPGPKGLRDSILIKEGEWFKMNYLQQIAFMQAIECSMAGTSGKQLLYMDVRSFETGSLLATWSLGTLETNGRATPQTNPSDLREKQDLKRVGLTGQGRANFIKSATEECNKRSPTIDCSCYASAVADYITIEELEEASGVKDRQAAITALRPKLEAAAKSCLKN